MKNTISNITEWAKSHPVATAVIVVLFAPGIIFGAVFKVLGFIGWGRIFLAILILGVWAGIKFAKSYLDGYKDTADDALSFARDLKDEFYK